MIIVISKVSFLVTLAQFSANCFYCRFPHKNKCFSYCFYMQFKCIILKWPSDSLLYAMLCVIAVCNQNWLHCFSNELYLLIAELCVYILTFQIWKPQKRLLRKTYKHVHCYKHVKRFFGKSSIFTKEVLIDNEWL